MLVDLHTHPDDVSLPLEALLQRARETQLDGVVLARHGAFHPLPEPRVQHGVRLFCAAEVPTDRGHYLVIVPDAQRLPALEELFGLPVGGIWPVRDVMARTRALDGAVVALHPYDANVPHPGGDILFTLPHLTAVEVVNPRHAPTYGPLAMEAAETLGLPAVGGSGARTPDEVGRGATLLAAEVQDEAELVEALRSGSCWPVDFSAPPEGLGRRGPSSASRAPAPAAAIPSDASRSGADGGAKRRRRRRR